MSFIKNVCYNVDDDNTKKRFARFGKGSFEKEETLMKLGAKISFYTGFLFLNDVVKLFAHNVSGKTKITGAILSNELDESKLRKFDLTLGKVRGKLSGYTIEGELEQKDLINLVETFDYAFLLLNLSNKDYFIKLGKKPPKPTEVKERFVKAKFPKNCINTLVDEFFFDIKLSDITKSCSVKELYQIEQINIPNDVKDFSKARIIAKRKGKIIRKYEIDGEKMIFEHPINY